MNIFLTVPLLIVLFLQSSCAFLTTYNNLEEPIYPKIYKCENSPIYYKIFTHGSHMEKGPGAKIFYRNEAREIEFDKYLKGIPVLSDSIYPYPKIEIGSMLYTYKKNKSEYSTTTMDDSEKNWIAILLDDKPIANSMVLEIYIKNNYRNAIHGTGTGVYGSIVSMLTLGIIPYYETYDYEVQVRLSQNGKTTDEEKVMRRKGSHTGSLFLYLHSRSRSIFSNTNIAMEQRNRPIERMIGTQVGNLIRKTCKRGI